MVEGYPYPFCGFSAALLTALSFLVCCSLFVFVLLHSGLSLGLIPVSVTLFFIYFFFHLVNDFALLLRFFAVLDFSFIIFSGAEANRCVQNSRDE